MCVVSDDMVAVYCCVIVLCVVSDDIVTGYCCIMVSNTAVSLGVESLGEKGVF
jgi:hypothetical protein